MKKWLIFFANAIKNQKILFFSSTLLVTMKSFLSILSVVILGKIFSFIQSNENGVYNNKITIFLLILLIVYIITIAVNIISSNLSIKSKNKLKIYCSNLYINIINKLDYLMMSDKKNKERLDILKAELVDNSCITDFLTLFSSLVSSILSFIVIGHYSFKLDFWLISILVLIFFISLTSGIVNSKKYIDKRINLASDINIENYLSSIFDDTNISREFLFFPIRNYFFGKWEEKHKYVNKKLNEQKNKGEIINIMALLVIALLIFFYVYIVTSENDKLNFSSLFVIYYAILNISNNIMYLGMIIIRFYISSIKLLKLDEIESKTIIDNYENKENNNYIVLENVSFAYNENNVLKNVNLKIEKGKKVGIVGPNGSGKSTLIKLLCGLYKPNEGNINVFGHNCYNDLINKNDIPISVVLQDFTIYHGYTIEENINLGKENETSEINKFNNLNNIDCKMIVGEELGGGNLSKGQWQSISILRSERVSKEILIYDEPTASLDPIAEKNFYSEMIREKKDKTIFVVTHRLATIKKFDIIIYIENGKIIEMGSHEELMSIKNGKYKEMFNEQVSWYK